MTEYRDRGPFPSDLNPPHPLTGPHDVRIGMFDTTGQVTTLHNRCHQHLAEVTPPAGLPAELATVDDVGRVCDAAGLEQRHGYFWFDGSAFRVYLLDGRERLIEVHGTDGWRVRIFRTAPTALLWHAIHAARGGAHHA